MESTIQETEVLIETRVNAAIYKQAETVLASRGMTVPDAVRVMLTHTAETGEVPLATESDGEFLSAENEPEGYDAWFRAKVQEALDDPRSAVPDSQVRAYFAKRRDELRSRTNL